jgi:hypothetical protein
MSINRAHAGDPEVVALLNIHKNCFSGVGRPDYTAIYVTERREAALKLKGNTHELITLQAHREAMVSRPVDMVLYCPKCNTQHIDAPESFESWQANPEPTYIGWTNPPHKSHLCAECGHIWRPSDTPTNGVLKLESGKDTDTQPLQNATRYADEVNHLRNVLQILCIQGMDALPYAWGRFFPDQSVPTFKSEGKELIGHIGPYQLARAKEAKLLGQTHVEVTLEMGSKFGLATVYVGVPKPPNTTNG